MGQVFGTTADTPTTTDAPAEKTVTTEASASPSRGSDVERWPCLEGVQSALCGPRPITRGPADSVERLGLEELVPGAEEEDVQPEMTGASVPQIRSEASLQSGGPSPSTPSGGMFRDQSRRTLQLPGATPKLVPPPPLSLANLRQQSAPPVTVGAAPRPPALDRAVSELSLRAVLAAGRQPFTEMTLKRLLPSSRPEGGQQDAPNSSVKSEKLQESALLCSFGTDISTPDLLPGMVPLPRLNNGLSTAASPSQCLICQEDVDELFLPDRLCQFRACKGAFCRPCLETYYTMKVEESRYAVPFIRCPSCNGYVRSASWRGCVGDRVYRQMKQSCADLLNLRCMDCDEPGTLLEDWTSSPEVREQTLKKLRNDLTQAQLCELDQWWSLYSRGEADAAQVGALIAPSEVNADDDGVPSRTLRAHIQILARLIEDPARRAVFQLGFLRRWPKTWSTCCSIPHCFKCKVGSHHAGISCEEVQRRQVQDETMQFCPGCNVATIKSEGCNHMICICGEEWTWQGEERWVDDWIGADGALEENSSVTSEVSSLDS